MYVVEGLVGFVVGVIQAVVKIQRDIQEVDDLNVGRDGNGKSDVPEEYM